AHYVAIGIFAYPCGAAASGGVAGHLRLQRDALVAPFAASLGDRFPRERFLLAMILVGAAALAGSAAAFAADAGAVVFALAALVGLAVTLIRPALQALLPSLARTPRELIAANGATSTIESLGTLAGPLLAAALVALADAGAVFAVGAATLVLAAVPVWRVRVRGRVDVALSSGGAAPRRMFAAGFHAILRTPRTRLVVGLMVAQTFVRGCLNVLIVVGAFRVLDAGAEAVGYLTASIGVGGLLGAVGAMTLRGRRLAVPFGISLVFWGMPIVLIAPSSELVAALLLLAVVGAANSVEDVAVFTLLQRLVPDRVLTRALGTIWSLAMAGVALGSIAAPAIVGAIGPRAAFVAVGSVLPLLTLLSYRRLAAIDREIAPVPGVELIERVPIFAPLSLAAKERLAANLEAITVPPGETVIQAGDVGDRFFILAEGAVEIDAGGVRGTAGPGDYFGEIALLHGVPRTATVTSLVESRLQALRRSDFLAAVTGHEAAHAAGQAVADERLARGGDAELPAAAERIGPEDAHVS
ncbi:MAG: MFS transporter, partial [Thermoleophilia bacterium]|nr:MFS transporter [Thermoleophilia bacterium]